jgi:hypothetical protein
MPIGKIHGFLRFAGMPFRVLFVGLLPDFRHNALFVGLIPALRRRVLFFELFPDFRCGFLFVGPLPDFRHNALAVQQFRPQPIHFRLHAAEFL